MLELAGKAEPSIAADAFSGYPETRKGFRQGVGRCVEIPRFAGLAKCRRWPAFTVTFARVWLLALVVDLDPRRWRSTWLAVATTTPVIAEKVFVRKAGGRIADSGTVPTGGRNT
ncbi:hypothetical protein [Micromonospora noduli]|uniref:hypothetical protein n=1 Tax=Micromonospora noduli TaxID=709876 RepID=UPI0011BEA27C|nr:hypothetical protein [Micromonospora noduli]